MKMLPAESERTGGALPPETFTQGLEAEETRAEISGMSLERPAAASLSSRHSFNKVARAKGVRKLFPIVLAAFPAAAICAQSPDGAASFGASDGKESGRGPFVVMV